MMSKLLLQRSCEHWNTDDFEATLKSEIAALPAGSLPLHLATNHGGMVDDSDIAISVLKASDDSNMIETKVCVFFSEKIGGCNCHDDPVSANLQCTMLVSIDKKDAVASFTLLDE